MKDVSQMDDWEFCHHSLVQVSRTFSKPIDVLPGDLRRGVTCGYLLCRLADTIEDNADLPTELRDRLYGSFISVMEDGTAPESFVAIYAAVDSQTDEDVLARNLAKVMRVYSALPAAMQQAITPWVTEMTRGMQIYSHRPVGSDGYTALTTIADLERYCYFVAGTVGHMLTDLFVAGIDQLSPYRQRQLRQNAEGFGLGLQLVNILKDITDDRQRRWSFIPRAVVATQGLTILTLTEPEHRERAHTALAPVFDRAYAHLDEAFEYCLALPADQREIRLFCLLPLWMAVKSLHHARGNDDQLIEANPVKISRAMVGELINQCVRHCQDDDALRKAYAEL